MIPVILSQSRRFAIFAFGIAVLAIAVMIRSGVDYSFASAGLLFGFVAICTLPISLALLAIAPNHRGMLEFSGFSALVASAVLFYVPASGVVLGLVTAGVFGATMFGILRFFRSELARKMAHDRSYRDSHACLIEQPAKRVWRHVVPGECPPSEHCTGIMLDCEEVDEGEDRHKNYRLTLKGRKGNAIYDVTFLDKSAPEVCRFYFHGTEGDGTIVDGVFALHVTVMDRDSCFVSSTEERNGLSLRAHVQRWFDNPLAFHNLRLKSMLQEKYGDPSQPTVAETA